MEADDTIFLNDSDWLKSPCSTCGSTYCCSYLPLCYLSMETRSEMLLMADLCWFEGLVPALKDDGQWQLFYHADCRFLHSVTGKCSIHGTSQQTGICRNYSPYDCWYEKAFRTTETNMLIRFTSERVEKLIEMTVFDEEGVVLSAPPWNVLQRTFSELPYARTVEPAVQMPVAKSVNDELLFLLPPGKPRRQEHLELIKFRLGFPGIMLMVSPSLWCFALPALVKSMVPENFRKILLQRLEAGVYDAIIMGLSEWERAVLHAGNFQRITHYGAVTQQIGIIPPKYDPDNPGIAIY